MSSRPIIGICTALERARWSVWDQQALLLPRSYVDAVQRAGGVALMLPPDAAVDRGARRAARPDRRPGAGRRRRRGPVELRRRAALQDDRHRARARRVRAGAGEPRDGARHAVPRHLPRDAGDERRARRHAEPAPARRRRPRGPPALARLVRQLRPRRAPRARLARGARRARGAARHQVAPSPGRRSHRRGTGDHGLGDDRRAARGDRAARQPLLARRAVAPRGGRDLAAGRRARRRGAQPTAPSGSGGRRPHDAGGARAGHGVGARRDPARGRRGGRRGGRARQGGLSRLARGRARRPRAAAAPARGRAGGRAGGAGGAGGPQRRQADRRRPRRDRHGRRHVPLLRRRGRAHARRHDPGRRRRRDDVPRAARRRRADHALELPAHDRLVEARAVPRGRQHRRAQAGRADPADRARVRADRARGRHPRGRRERRRRARVRRAGRGSSSIPTSPRSRSPARPRSGAGSPRAPPRRSSA